MEQDVKITLLSFDWCSAQTRQNNVTWQTPSWLSIPIVKSIEIDTLEYQQTEKIETELKDVDRIRANRCTQLCPGSPSGASRAHNTIYYSFPADSPPSRKEAPRWRVLYRITRQLLHRARCGSFSQKIETASWAKPANPKYFMLLCRISCELAGCVHQPFVHDSWLRPNKP